MDISREGDKALLRFTHGGLAPALERYNACAPGWTSYLRRRLLSLITTGQSQPDKVAL